MRSLVRVQDRPWRLDGAPTGVEPGGTRSKKIPSSRKQTPGAIKGQPTAPRQGWNPAEPAPKRFRQAENRRRAPLRGNRHGKSTAPLGANRHGPSTAPLRGTRHGKSLVPLGGQPPRQVAGAFRGQLPRREPSARGPTETKPAAPDDQTQRPPAVPALQPQPLERSSHRILVLKGDLHDHPPLRPGLHADGGLKHSMECINGLVGNFG